jgi:hypothetical protein
VSEITNRRLEQIEQFIFDEKAGPAARAAAHEATVELCAEITRIETDLNNCQVGIYRIRLQVDRIHAGLRGRSNEQGRGPE